MIETDPIVIALAAAVLFALAITLRLVAALWLRPDHPVNRIADAAERPLWAVRPAPHDPHAAGATPMPGGDRPCD
ncbi:MAG: hypothetical protein ACK4TB_18100 [Gemmobacter sp.]